MTGKTIDTLGIVHYRLMSLMDLPLPIRITVCGVLDPTTFGDVIEANVGAQVTCLTCLVYAIEAPSCSHDIHGPVHACPFALRPGHEGPSVRCHCCSKCTAECAVDPCYQSCCVYASLEPNADR